MLSNFLMNVLEVLKIVIPVLFGAASLFYILVIILIIRQKKLTGNNNVKLNLPLPRSEFVKKYEYALDVLRQGNPKEAIELYKKLYSEVEHKKNAEKNKFLIRNNLAVGYSDDGDTAAAVAIWEGLISETSKELWKVVVHFNLATCYLRDNRLTDFLREQETVNNIAQKHVKKHIKNSFFTYSVEALNMKYAVLQGEYEEPLAFCQKRFSNAKDLSEQCFSMHEMAAIYEKHGEVEKQKDCLKYLAENGNDLYIAREAREILKQFPEKFDNNEGVEEK